MEDYLPPFELFALWLEEAEKTEPTYPNAMALATVDNNQMPNNRVVLMKDYDETGLVFYTNFESQKGEELTANPRASALFFWKSQGQQVRFRGVISRVSDEEADVYFASRPRDSRLGAWASQQSRPLKNSFALEKAVAAEAARFGFGTIPRPPYWGGFRLAPLEIEFWLEKPFRLHERVLYRRKSLEDSFDVVELYP